MLTHKTHWRLWRERKCSDETRHFRTNSGVWWRPNRFQVVRLQASSCVRQNQNKRPRARQTEVHQTKSDLGKWYLTFAPTCSLSRFLSDGVRSQWKHKAHLWLKVHFTITETPQEVCGLKHSFLCPTCLITATSEDVEGFLSSVKKTTTAESEILFACITF